MGHLSEWQMLFWYDPKTKFLQKFTVTNPVHMQCYNVYIQRWYRFLRKGM